MKLAMELLGNLFDDFDIEGNVYQALLVRPGLVLLDTAEIHDIEEYR